MLDELQTYRQLLFDLTANYLEPLRSNFERLAYLAKLRQAETGRYRHERLEAVYGAEPVDKVLRKCHEEVFERLLEMPLEAQEDELRLYVSACTGSLSERVERCREQGRGWVPQEAPSYLIELYSSNLHALLELILDNSSTVR